MPCRAATSATCTPGASHSARMRSLSATLQRRRRSRPVMISTAPLPMTLQPTLRPTLRPPASTDVSGQGRRPRPDAYDRAYSRARVGDASPIRVELVGPKPGQHGYAIQPCRWVIERIWLLKLDSAF